MNHINPYSVSTLGGLQKGYFGDHAALVDSSFLFRVIEVAQPCKLEFYYSGWWFVQRIRIDGILVWRKISWSRLSDRADFSLPASVDPQCRSGTMEIDFSRGLRIRRFRLWIADQLVFDEIN